MTHPNELDCDPCAEVGVSTWFATEDELVAHVRATHPDRCAECEGFEAECRRENRTTPDEPAKAWEGWPPGWVSIGAVAE